MELSPDLTEQLRATRTWLAIGLVVAAHEVLCPPGELLSEGCDRALQAHPHLVRAAIGITALHLANLLPEQLDPFSKILKFIKPE